MRLGWMQALYETYENCSHMVGVKGDDEKILLPVAHTTQNAQVEITVNLSGKLIRAETVDKKNAVTIIPVTEDSGSRSSGIAPHPLCDKLIYIAGDYKLYSDEKGAEKAEKAYLQYITELGKWCSSEQKNKKVAAVYEYLKQGTVIRDLIAVGIISLNSNGRIEDSIKVNGIASTELFARFRIEDFELDGEEAAVWQDREIYQSYIDYILANQGQADLCYVSGANTPCSYKHPAKLRNAADKAKLISANDESGFTYRGRFARKEQAFSVGYLTSQKAHNALRWLMERQGYTRSGLALLVWEKNDKKPPDILGSTKDILPEKWEGLDSDLGYSYAKQLRNAINGRWNDLMTKARVYIISLDAATTGRLAINYYCEMEHSELIDRLIDWHETCMWEHVYWKEDNTRGVYIGAPKTEDIVTAAYGYEINGKLTVKDDLKKAAIERLLPCIIEKKKLPGDIVWAAIRNASRPQTMEPKNWVKVFHTACALVYKYMNYKVEDWSMALDIKEKDRSYLYGRLLAIADRAEYVIYDRDEKRQTNAKRYMQQFQKKPFTTWEIIERSIQPYLNKMAYKGQVNKYEDLLHEVHDRMETKDYADNSPLNGMYLLGFHCQAKALKNTEEVKTNE